MQDTNTDAPSQRLGDNASGEDDTRPASDQDDPSTSDSSSNEVPLGPVFYQNQNFNFSERETLAHKDLLWRRGRPLYGLELLPLLARGEVHHSDLPERLTKFIKGENGVLQMQLKRWEEFIDLQWT